MPNHCESDLTITGPREVVAEFLAKHVTEDDGTVLSLESIRPYPKEFKELDRIANEWRDGLDALRPTGDGPVGQEAWKAIYQEYVRTHGERPTDGFNSGGYSWCVQNWGTKWGCYHQDYTGKPPITRRKDGVVLHFSTAWSPFSTELLEEVSARFPQLRFSYKSYEGGMGFKCHTVVKGGEVLQDLSGDYRGRRGG